MDVETPQPPSPAAADPDEDRGIASAQLRLELLRQAPCLPGGHDLGASTCAVRPWPHQWKVVRQTVEHYPRSYLFCDEVGLGKTIEVALVLRQLVISGRVRRALLLVPKAVLRQWQEELYEKACLDLPIFVGGRFLDVFGKEVTPASPDPNPWNRHPLFLASTQLARSRAHRAFLLEAEPWDLLVVDEAHHARRRRMGNGAGNGGQANRLLELLGGSTSPTLTGGERAAKGGLVQRSRCVYLLTATPMQVHPLEMWDLLRLLGLGGAWGADEQTFLAFFEELQKPVAERDWRLVGRLFREAEKLSNRGALAGSVEKDAAPAEAPSDDLVSQWLSVLRKGGPTPEELGIVGNFSEPEIQRLDEHLRRSTPVQHLVWRHTREQLREYRRLGLSQVSVPERRPENVWIELREAERQLYDRIEDYLRRFYQRYEKQRPGLGFVMTIYRRRLTSSFVAMGRSLERRRRYLLERSRRYLLERSGETGDPHLGSSIDRGSEADQEPGRSPERGAETVDGGGAEIQAGGFEAAELDGSGQGDLFSPKDVSNELPLADSAVALSQTELEYVDEFLEGLGALQGDSKLDQLSKDLEELLGQRDRVLVFTQYTDTLDYLREALRPNYRVACYSGRGGEMWMGSEESSGSGEWEICGKEDIKAAFARGEIQVLLATEAASEGLNLQTCGVLINYDVPWNPMRLEQRIGRIDRLGQEYSRIWVRSYFYAETIEAAVYSSLNQRIADFQEVVGELPPILHRVEETIQELAMAGEAAPSPSTSFDQTTRKASALVEGLVEEPDRPPPVVFDTAATLAPSLPGPPKPPATLEDLRGALLAHPTVARRVQPHPQDPGIFTYQGRLLTFLPELYDSRPYSLELVTWGSRAYEDLMNETRPGVENGTEGAPKVGEDPGVESISSDDPAGIGLYRSWNPAPVSLFLGPGPKGELEPISRYSDLEAATRRPQRRWTGDEESRATALFSRTRRKVLRAMESVVASRRGAARTALAASAAEILKRAAHLELAKAESPSLFEQTPPFGFGAEAVLAQARHGKPFSELLDLATAPITGASPPELPEAHADDPGYRAWQRRPTSAMEAEWKQLLAEGNDILRRLKSLQGAETQDRQARHDPSAAGILERSYFVVGELEKPPWRPELLEPDTARPFVNAIPFYDDLLLAAREMFEAASEGRDPSELALQDPQEIQWIELHGRYAPGPNLFAAPMPLRALEPRYPEGATMLFRLQARTPAENQPAIIHHPDLVDPETGSSITLRYLKVENQSACPRLVLRASHSDMPTIYLEDPESSVEVLGVVIEALGPFDSTF